MFSIFDIPSQALFGQLLIGLINGSFYALLSLGLAVIFGMLNIINFSHGAQYMLGAFAAYLLLQYSGLGYWGAFVLTLCIAFAGGIAVQLVAIRPVERRGNVLTAPSLDAVPAATPAPRSAITRSPAAIVAPRPEPRPEPAPIPPVRRDVPGRPNPPQ